MSKASRLVPIGPVLAACALAALPGCPSYHGPAIKVVHEPPEADLDTPAPRFGPIHSATDAIATLPRAWKQALAPHVRRDRPTVAKDWRAAFTGYSAGRTAMAMSCAAGAERIRTTAATEPASILYGRLEELAKASRCWELTVRLELDSLTLYLTEDAGLLVLAWWPPED